MQPNGPKFEDKTVKYKDVTLTPVQPAGFGCPCHGGAYDTEGNRTAGPPVRSLDRYAFSIVNGNLVLGKHFSVGTVEGTGADAKISRYRQAYPGVHVDGIERWLYPIPGAGVLTMAKSARQAQIEKAALYPLDWVEERTGLVGGVKWFLFRNVPRDVNWMQTLGAATLTAFLVQATTGVFLAMYYKPDPNSAYESIQNITNEVTLGWLVRGMHKWGASLFIILMFLHMARTFLFGAYKYPRELNWIIGVLLLVTGMLEGFTGYLLPWDQTAYWATVVGINLNATAPIAGPFLAQFLQGGAQIGPDTLAKFYSLHMLADPRRDHGPDRSPPVSRRPARRHLAAVVEGRGGPTARRGCCRAGTATIARASSVSTARSTRRGRRVMASKLQQEKRAEFKRYKEDVAKEGKPFFPYAILHDTIMSLVVVAVIIGLAVIWKFTSDDGDVGVLGPLYTDKADPGTTNFVPRPDWFFYFLFYLLRIFKWPETVVLGTVGVPTLLLVLLIGLPFFDRRPERAILRRPVAIRRGDPRRHLDGRADVEGRDREGGARLGDRGPRAGLGEAAGLRRQPGRRRRGDPVRGIRLPQLPRLPRHGQQQPRRPRPVGRRRQGPRGRMAGCPPHESE